MIGLMCIGAAQQSVDETCAYVTERQAFGAPLARFEGVSFPLAEAAVRLRAARLLCYEALWLKDRGEPHGWLAAGAKWLAPELCRRRSASMPAAPRASRLQPRPAASAADARRDRTRDWRRHRADHEDAGRARDHRQGCAPVLEVAFRWLNRNGRSLGTRDGFGPGPRRCRFRRSARLQFRRRKPGIDSATCAATVQLDAVPASVPARVTADSRFVLFVNGVEVARGPARSIPERLAWTEIDLAPYLRAGRNAIAALVRFYGVPGPWWRPATPSFLLGFGSFAFESPAIGVISDASWKGRAAPYRQDVVRGAALPVPPTEILDGARGSGRMERRGVRRFRMAAGGRIVGRHLFVQSHANPGRAFHRRPSMTRSRR